MTPSRFRVLCAVCLLALEAASAQASTLTSVPSDTTLTLGDQVVIRAVLDAQPDVKGASLGWTGSPALVGFVGAHAADVFTSTSLFSEFLAPYVAAPADSASSVRPSSSLVFAESDDRSIAQEPLRHDCS